jgi:hypothetical protein
VGPGKEWGSYEKEGNKNEEVLKVYWINNFFEQHNYIIM